MKLLASLMFNRVRITLQPIYVTLQQIVFSLQAVQLFIKGLRVLPFLLECRQPVLPEDDVIAHCQREYASSTCCDLAPAELGSF